MGYLSIAIHIIHMFSAATVDVLECYVLCTHVDMTFFVLPPSRDSDTIPPTLKRLYTFFSVTRTGRAECAEVREGLHGCHRVRGEGRDRPPRVPSCDAGERPPRAVRR